MIFQRPQATHARDREIAAMPMRREETLTWGFRLACVLFWAAFFGAVFGWAR